MDYTLGFANSPICRIVVAAHATTAAAAPTVEPAVRVPITILPGMTIAYTMIAFTLGDDRPIRGENAEIVQAENCPNDITIQHKLARRFLRRLDRQQDRANQEDRVIPASANDLAADEGVDPPLFGELCVPKMQPYRGRFAVVSNVGVISCAGRRMHENRSY